MRKHTIVTPLGGRWEWAGSARRAIRLMLVGLLVLPQTLAPAVITVDGTDSTVAVDGVCSLREAIDNANSNSDTSGGDCAAGDDLPSGGDTIALTADVTLTLVDHTSSGSNGLPVISTDVIIDGGGFTIARDGTAPPFRIFRVGGSGTLSLVNTTVSNGDASGGGGISIYVGTTTLTNSTVSGNSAFYGGGIYSREGALTLTNSTVSGNSASNRGGGIVNYASLVTLTNSTVSGNQAGGLAGGIYIAYSFYASTTLLTNSTVSGNSASSDGNIYGELYAADSSLTLTNSILVGGDCGLSGNPIVDGGGNFTDSAGCPGAAITDGTEIDTTLADNGGPTETHALLSGSPAIEAAGTCTESEDQRGAGRVGDCDSGAFEYIGCDELLLADDWIVRVITWETCHTARLTNLSVAPGGVLTVTAGALVILENGVALLEDSVVILGIDPDLQVRSPESLMLQGL